MNAPEIQETLSPYWLRLYGHWVHIDGVVPENDVEPGRAFSELVTVDGHRYAQRAPRGPRTWTLDFDHATAAATAALESAAYTNNYDDPTTRTLFMDRNHAKANMVNPDLNTLWSDKVPQFVMNVGEGAENPIWLPSYGSGEVPGSAPQIFIYRAYYSLLPGVTYTAAVWTQVSTGNSVLRVADAVTNVEVDEYIATGGGTSANPELATVTIPVPAGDPAGKIYVLEMAGSPYNAGLMLYEGDCPPEYYRAGRRMPCPVSVQDPGISTNLIWPANCDPCKLPRETTTWTIREVGTSARVDLVPVVE